MPWARIDDEFHDNVKVVEAGTLAVGLYTLCLSWAAEQLTDGKIPAKMIHRLCCDVDDPILLAERLVEVGLFERDGNDYLIHDYLEYNPSRVQVLAERDAARERMRTRRNANGTFGESSGNVRPNIDETSDCVRSTPVPFPVPTTTTTAARNVDLTESKPPETDSCTAMLHKCLAQAGQFPSMMMAELYEQAIENVNDPELIRLAFEDTAKNGKRMSPRYLESIIERCARDGVLPGVWPDSKKPPGARASPEKPIREQLTPEQVNALIDAEMRREYGINNTS